MRFAAIIIVLLLGVTTSLGQSVRNKSTDYKGTKINYLDIGNERAEAAIVFVHCWTCSSEFWRDSYKAFADRRVIALDLPGHGTSDRPKLDYSIEYFARSVDAVLKKAKVKRAVLAGHSMGTPVIRKYYELFPKRVRGLIIVDGALLPYENRSEVDKFFEPIYADYKANAPRFIDGMLPRDEKLRTFVRSAMLATSEHVAVSAMRLMIDDSYQPHANLNVPVLAVMAPSPYWPKDLEERYRAIAPQLTFEMWEGTSHFLHMERPERFNAAVASFLAAHKLP